MLFHNIYGHKGQIEKLLMAKKNQRLPHALLFAGPEGIGKKKIAFALAQGLLCEKAHPACGQCPSCVSVQNQKNPHIMFIQPEGLYIKVDSIRKISHFISLQSLAPARVIIIDSAHQMNLTSANSFLKILEEPPNGVYFFLISSSMSALLVTIRSRTQIIRLAPLLPEDIRAVVQKIKTEEEENPWFIEMAQGSMSVMEKWKEHRALIDQAWELLGKIDPEKSPCSLEELNDLVRNRQQALLVCSCWQKVLRGARVGKVTNNLDPIYGGQKELLVFLTQIKAPLLDLFFEKTIQLEQDLKAYVDSRLLFDNFLFFCRDKLQKHKTPFLSFPSDNLRK